MINVSIQDIHAQSKRQESIERLWPEKISEEVDQIDEKKQKQKKR